MMAERLSNKALVHCEAVAELAAKLAEVYDVSTDDARLAGLLHDWSREDTQEEIFSIAEGAEIPITELDAMVPYLLHAKTGAAEIRQEFPDIGEHVLASIELHTMGGAKMTDLDRIVYISDMTEPGRSFPGVEELRDQVGKVPLSELFIRAYSRSIIHLVESRKKIHPETIDVWNGNIAKEPK